MVLKEKWGGDWKEGIGTDTGVDHSKVVSVPIPNSGMGIGTVYCEKLRIKKMKNEESKFYE